MTRNEVEKILGPPVGVESPPGIESIGESLIYFRRLPPPINYPMLWVHSRDGKVVEVYAKRHNVLDSDGVYGISEATEQSAPRRWESPRFIETFPESR